MLALPEWIGHGHRNILHHVPMILPAGILWGSAIALSLSRHNDLNAVIIILLSVSGAVSVLLYRNTVQQVRFGRVALVVGFAFIASRSLPQIKSLSFVDVAISCIQFFAVCMVIITSAVAMRRPNAIPRTQQTEDVANEDMNSLTPGARSQPGTPESSVGDPFETKSEHDSLLFGHMEGQKLQPAESASGEAPALALFPDSKVDPARVFEILGLVKTVSEASSGKEDEATARPPV